jgi:hypothetical protein
MSIGFSFGNVKLYQLRKYYRSWLENTLLEASKLPDTTWDIRLVMEFRSRLTAPFVIDDGILPCSIFQKHEAVSRSEGKMVCLIVLLRHIVQTWWECSETDPQQIEELLVHLDSVVEGWEHLQSVGNQEIGFTLS